MLTVAEYSDVKALEPTLLRACAVHDSARGVTFPYLDQDKQSAAIRYRPEWDKFLWHSGDHPLPYGVWHGIPADGKDIAICEGESDSLTLWQHGIRALGIPGASMWKDEWRRLLGRARPVLLMEPDDAARGLVKRLAQGLGVIWYTTLLQYKDASEAYLALGAEFPGFIRERMAMARLLSPERQERRVAPETEPGDCLEIAKSLTTMTRRGEAWWGCCPFHQEKTPSFHVTSKGFFCFGCGKGGGAGTLKRLAGLTA